MRHFISGKKVAVDTEATGLFPWLGDNAFAISFCNEDLEQAYFEWPVEPFTRKVIPNKRELRMVKDFMEDERVAKVFWNANFDVRILEQGHSIQTAGPGGLVSEGGQLHDAMFSAHVCHSLEHNYQLKALSKKYLGIEKLDEQALKKEVITLRRKAKKLKWIIAEDVEADYWLPQAFEKGNALCGNYCRQDTLRTMLMHLFHMEAMRDLKGLETYEIEMTLWNVTYRMQTRGVRVKPKIVEREIIKHEARSKVFHDKLLNYAWDGFNVDSPDQLAKLLYEELDLPILSKTKGGKPSTDMETLIKLVEKHEAVATIIKYRAAEKALATYFYNDRKHGLPDPLTQEMTYALHPEFNQVGPATGRFSCRKPNMQNVANDQVSRSTDAIQARMPFGPRPGYFWYCLDYQNLEVRIFADVAQEKFMLSALNAGKDLHGECANFAWGGKDNPSGIDSAIHALELDGFGHGNNPLVKAEWKRYGVKNTKRLSERDATEIATDWMQRYGWKIVEAEKSLGLKNTRSKAKMALFLKTFGGGWRAAQVLLRSTEKVARKFVQDYDEAFPRIPLFGNECSTLARERGYVLTRFGRRLSINPHKAYRSVNYIVQGSAADLLKRAMLKTNAYLQHLGLDIHLLMCVHDELIFEIKKEDAYIEVLRDLGQIMADHEGAFRIDTPVEIEKVVRYWNKKIKVEKMKGVIYAC